MGLQERQGHKLWNGKMYPGGDLPTSLPVFPPDFLAWEQACATKPTVYLQTRNRRLSIQTNWSPAFNVLLV